MKKSTDMAARLMEKLKVNSQTPEMGQVEEGAAPDAPPASHGKMATPDAPPGLELDEHGDPIPLSERTERHRAEAQALKP